MLHLKRVLNFNDFLRCDVSEDLITHGDYYYEDDEDGLIVKAIVLSKMKEEKRNAEFDYSKLEKAETMEEYKQMLKELTRAKNEESIANRKIAYKEMR